MVEQAQGLPALVDYIAFAQDPDLKKLIGNDTLVYANNIKKTNSWGMSQVRLIAITNNAIYNIHGKKIKRSIMIKDISGITKTVHPKNQLEFTLHISRSYDYRYVAECRQEIMDVIKRMYYLQYKTNVPVYYVQVQNLEKYTTTEKDSQKGISRMPPPQQRTRDEDLFKEEQENPSQILSTQEVEKIDEDGEIDIFVSKADLEDKIRRRSKQIRVGMNLNQRLSQEDQKILENPAELVAQKTPPSLVRQRTNERTEEEFNFLMEREIFHSQTAVTAPPLDQYTPGGPGENDTTETLRQEKHQSASNPSITPSGLTNNEMQKLKSSELPPTQMIQPEKIEQLEENKSEQISELTSEQASEEETKEIGQMPIQKLVPIDSLEIYKDQAKAAKAKGPTPGFVSIAEQQRQLQQAENLKKQAQTETKIESMTFGNNDPGKTLLDDIREQQQQPLSLQDQSEPQVEKNTSLPGTKQEQPPSGEELLSPEEVNQNFDNLLDTNFEINKERASMKEESQSIFKKKRNVESSLADFEIKKRIGEGTFGKVFLVEHKQTKILYAMKCIRKDLIIEHNQLTNITMEKNILLQVDHPFLVNMEYVFQNEYRIYFLMKFIKGGELFRHLVEVKHFPEDQVRFFTMQVAFALGHLHSQNIVYRDLKPENVLVGEDGYLLVADFGLAKLIKDGEATSTFCGTPEYLAPEMFEQEAKYDFMVDWWALGTLMYEMLVGIPPFYHHKQHRMFRMIRKNSVNFPDSKHGFTISDQAKDLMNKLLIKDPNARLGKQGGMQEILSHPWFAELNQADVLAKKIPSPYIPKVETDLHYFDPMLTTSTETAASVVPKDKRAIIDKSKQQFEGFETND